MARHFKVRGLLRNVAVREDGVKIRVDGRSGVLYQRGRRKLLWEGEIVMTPGGFMLASRHIGGWKRPFEHEVISDEEMQNIREDILEALPVLGYHDIDIYDV